ncbi:non-specific serine/threonine protein kinase [Ranunculus cassubicifolius]
MAVESVEESSLSEPPDTDIIVEIDPTGRYIRYKEVLGSGSSKTVYKAFDEIEGIEVAWNQIDMKIFFRSPQDLGRLYSEVHLLKTLHHENIIKYYYSWVDDKNNKVNIITELFTSGSLRQYRMKHKKVDIKAVKRWARQILKGLNYLHCQNPPIIHRDLKCDNIFINGNHGEVKIGDLGLAIIMQHANCCSVLGTPEFMAPELYEEDYNELVDIYSFGLCLLEMVTFEYPYCECANQAQIYKKVSSGIKPASLSKVKDKEVRLFIEKCLVPVAERLSAKELLMDPFLKDDGLTENSSLDLYGTASPKIEAIANHSVLSEEANDKQKIIPVRNYGDAKPHTTSCIENSIDESHMRDLVIRMTFGCNDFKLIGGVLDVNTVILNLYISEQNGPTRKVHFGFYLDNDTSNSVAREMVDQLEISHQNVMFIAGMIDMYLINTIPSWIPSVPVSQLEAMNDHIQTSNATSKEMFEEREAISVVSLYNLFGTLDLSNVPPPLDSSSAEGSIHAICEAHDYVKLDEVLCLADYRSHNMTQHRNSNTSFASAVSIDGNIHANNTYMSMDSGYMEYNGYGMKLETGEAPFRAELGGSDTPMFSKSPSNASSVFSEQCDDEEFKTELKQIELEYQQAMKEISRKRYEAIMAAKKRSLQKKNNVNSLV